MLYSSCRHDTEAEHNIERGDMVIHRGIHLHTSRASPSDPRGIIKIISHFLLIYMSYYLLRGVVKATKYNMLIWRHWLDAE